MNIAKLNEVRCLEKPDWIRLSYEDRKISNREIVCQARELVTALKNLGVKHGDRIIVQTPNPASIQCTHLHNILPPSLDKAVLFE